MDTYDDEMLEKIRVAPWECVLDLVEEAWDKSYGSSRDELTYAEWRVVGGEEGDRYLRLATGGWSWNEAVLSAFHDNTLGWMFHWVLSARGGLRIFKRIRE